MTLNHEFRKRLAPDGHISGCDSCLATTHRVLWSPVLALHGHSLRDLLLPTCAPIFDFTLKDCYPPLEHSIAIFYKPCIQTLPAPCFRKALTRSCCHAEGPLP